jgi:hypothetical protein
MGSIRVAFRGLVESHTHSADLRSGRKHLFTQLWHPFLFCAFFLENCRTRFGQLRPYGPLDSLQQRTGYMHTITLRLRSPSPPLSHMIFVMTTLQHITAVIVGIEFTLGYRSFVHWSLISAELGWLARPNYTITERLRSTSRCVHIPPVAPVICSFVHWRRILSVLIISSLPPVAEIL